MYLTWQSPGGIKCYFSMCTVLNKAFILINALLNKHKYQDTPIYKAWSYHLSKVYAIKWQSYLKCIHLWLHEFHICMYTHFPLSKVQLSEYTYTEWKSRISDFFICHISELLCFLYSITRNSTKHLPINRLNSQ